MKRHIPHDYKNLTLCGIFAPHRLLSEGEYGVAFDACKKCARLFEKATEWLRDAERRVKETERLLAMADEALAKPCGCGCGT